MYFLRQMVKWVSVLLLGFLVALVLFFFGMRSADGPLGPVAGGPFSTGKLYRGPEPDWSPANDWREVEVQLLEPARSRTTWVATHEGRLYIPCGFMDNEWVRRIKSWPYDASKDGRAILRVDGVLYERMLVRLEDAPHLAGAVRELARKYYGRPEELPLTGERLEQQVVDSLERVREGSLWIFELAPRAGAS